MPMKEPTSVELIATIAAGNSDEIVEAIWDVDLGIPGNRWTQSDLLDCLIDAWAVVCERPAGAFQVLLWFERSLRKLSLEERERVRRVVSESYGKLTDGQTTLEVAEWFGGFGSEESLKFITYWLDCWESMASDQKKCLDGFFREAFEVTEGRPDTTIFDQLIALEARYDALRPPSPGVPPRHRPVGPDAFWKS